MIKYMILSLILTISSIMFVQTKRPPHVDSPQQGGNYWCIVQPEFRDKTFLINLPWLGEYKDGYLLYPENPSIMVKASRYNLFLEKKDAENAIIYDWNNPPKSVSGKLILSEDTYHRVKKAISKAKKSQRLSDGAVPGLMIIEMDVVTQQQLLSALASDMNLQIVPKMNSDEPPREKE